MSLGFWKGLGKRLGIVREWTDEHLPEWQRRDYVPPELVLEPESMPCYEPVPPPPVDAVERRAALIRELPAAASALRVLALFPSVGLPWYWLETLVLARHPEAAHLPPGRKGLRKRLEESALAVTHSERLVARISPKLAADWSGDPEDEEAREIRAVARVLVLQRLQEIDTEQERRIERRRARERWRQHKALLPGYLGRYSPADQEDPANDAAYLTDYGLWERPYLQAFIRDELLSGSPERMEWALRTDRAAGTEVGAVRAELEARYRAEPDNRQALRLWMLFLFNEGRTRLSMDPYTRSGWYPVRDAVEILDPLRARHPTDPEIEALWKEGWRRFKLYDW
jgi:hypothetical protein